METTPRAQREIKQPSLALKALTALALIQLGLIAVSKAQDEESSKGLYLCTVDRVLQEEASVREEILHQDLQLQKAQKTLYDFYLPELRKEIAGLPSEARNLLAPNLLYWLNNDNYQKTLELKLQPAESLDESDVAALIDYEMCWQSLLGYILTLSTNSYNDSGPVEFFNEAPPYVVTVDTNRYLAFLVQGTVKLSELIRSSATILNLLKDKVSFCAPEFPPQHYYGSVCTLETCQ